MLLSIKHEAEGVQQSSSIYKLATRSALIISASEKERKAYERK